jgi:hypothetical protein
MNARLTLIALLHAAGACLAVADTLHVPAQFPTIQAAIDAAINDDTVLVADGIYTGIGNRELNFGGRAITVRSSGGASQCIIDIQGSVSTHRRGFIFNSGETGASILEGFTIRNGYAVTGGAVLIENNSSPLIRDCIFHENTARPTENWSGGGAVHIASGGATFINCRFESNRVEVVQPFNSGDGGAIWTQGAAVVFDTCEFLSNQVAGVVGQPGGGGAISITSGSHATVSHCTFTGKSAANAGGAMLVRAGAGSPSSAEVRHCQFQSNNAYLAAAFCAFEGGHSIVTDSHFIQNTATQCCGAITIAVATTATISNCIIRGNTVGTDAGAALVVQWEGSATVVNSLLQGNSSRGTSVAVFDNGAATLINCTIVGNDSVLNHGALRALRGGHINLQNSVVWGNTPSVQMAVSGSPIGTTTVQFSAIQFGWPGAISADPLFTNPSGGNYRLGPGSPCIDSANNTLVPSGILTDLDGNPRFHDDPASPNTGIPGGAGGPAITDMGAYEFHFCYPNCDGSTVQPILNVDDFSCFINEYAQAQSLPHAQQIGHYTNCDNSTNAPVLNVDDFTCFINRFAAGCP